MELTNGMGSLMCAIVKSTMGMGSIMGMRSAIWVKGLPSLVKKLKRVTINQVKK